MTHHTMNTETTVSPDAETQNQAAEVTETPEVVTPEAEVEAAGKPEEGDESDKALKRMQRRIDKRTADVYRERARAEQLAQRLAELEAKGSSEAAPAKEMDVESLVEERASVKAFAETANRIVETGTKQNADFVDALKDLASEVGEFVQRNGKPSPFMEVVLEVSDDPTKLLYHLGKNPDIAEELANLSPYKLAKRLDRIERELGESSKPKTSQAPKPLEPVKSKSVVNTLPSDEDSTEVWIKKERERMAKAGIKSYG